MSGRSDWGVHLCVLDRDCRRNAGWCWRIQLFTPRHSVGVALRPADKFVSTRQVDGSYEISGTRWVDWRKR